MPFNVVDLGASGDKSILIQAGKRSMRIGVLERIGELLGKGSLFTDIRNVRWQVFCKIKGRNLIDYLESILAFGLETIGNALVISPENKVIVVESEGKLPILVFDGGFFVKYRIDSAIVKRLFNVLDALSIAEVLGHSVRHGYLRAVD